MLRSIGDHPWTSLQDGALALSVLAVFGLLSIEYDLFWFAAQLSVEQRRISAAEAALLTLLLGGCIIVFIQRRAEEQQSDAKKRRRLYGELRELRDQVLRDPLTELPNRRAVFEHLEALKPGEDGRHHAFFLLDLNEFKRINDGHGHGTGDSVLRVVAQRFKTVLRPSDLLARLGGDEFAVLAYDVDRANAAAVGSRFIGSLENRIVVDGIGHDVGVSIGAVLIPEDGRTEQQIVTNADMAMYRAKAVGRSALVFYDREMSRARRYPGFAG